MICFELKNSYCQRSAYTVYAEQPSLIATYVIKYGRYFHDSLKFYMSKMCVLYVQ